MTDDHKLIKREPQFLDQALGLAREVIVLRGRLASSQHEHAELSTGRAEALREGRDVLPRIRELFLEIEKLPIEIARLQDSTHWLVKQGIDKVNLENRQTAAHQYMKCRDTLRPALERVREALASVLRDMQTGADLGPSLTDRHDLKLAEIEGILGGAHFSRVEYRVPPLPTLNAELVSRNHLLTAFDNWIGGLC